MRFALDAVKADDSADGRPALDVLNYGWQKANEAQQPGGCPVVLVTLVEDTFASILNLGDCGVVVLRDSKLLFRSEMQQHGFNCPYQLPADPPSRGEQARLQLREGDVFLCASDGVLDNVEVDELLDAMRKVDAKGCVHAATAIGELAHKRGHDRRYASPFARHAAAAGYRYMGGKLDDVTALVAKVTRREDAMVGGPELISDVLKIQPK
ncbi:protein phosphatase 2C [Strigomonas culicis]|nr:protein phosphatase 2C [Strigomonas culicis]|eukprot:EPY35807.1 protein phosphatase 2C [Strigomonas culicis]